MKHRPKIQTKAELDRHNKEISSEEIDRTITEMFCKEIYGESWTPETNKQIYAEGELENILLSGYWYTIGRNVEPIEGHRRVMAQTGVGGVKEYIQACKRQGIVNEDWIASNIEVFINGEYIKLTDPRLHHVNLKDEDNKKEQ